MLIWQISNTGKIHADNNILVIEKAAPADSGTYTCVNENIAGTTEMQIHVKVISEQLNLYYFNEWHF